MFRTFLCAAATIITCGSGMASAATFNFETGNPFNGQELNYTVDGISLSVTANGNRVVNSQLGLGVNDLNNDSDSARITTGEILTFTVGPRPIRSLVSVLLEGGPEAERIEILVGGLRAERVLPAAGGRSRVSVDLSGLLSPGTTQFSFVGVEQEEVGKNRGVLISGIEIAAVPVPAAILSLGTGLALLGGLGSFRRGSTRKSLLGKAAA